MNMSISQLFYGTMSADEGGRVAEISTFADKVFQQNEVMPVEAIQESMTQEEVTPFKEERNSQSPLPSPLLKQLQMGTSAEGQLLE